LLEGTDVSAIVGFIYSKADRSSEELTNIVDSMAQSLRYRGPDAAGTWVDSDTGIALAHQHLAVTDCVPIECQPAVSSTGRWVVAYDGAIYNTRALHRELESAGCSLERDSESSVVSASIETWGVQTTVKKLVGMFALAAWGSENRRLYLVRDHIGARPLYLGWMKDCFLFGSDLKAFRAHPEWNGRIDRGVFALLMGYGFIPAPYSIYEAVYKHLPRDHR